MRVWLGVLINCVDGDNTMDLQALWGDFRVKRVMG